MISLNIENNSGIPKYKQIINSIIEDIEESVLKLNDQLPSINELSEEYYLSRDTVEKAYVELKERGIITSIPGKGYFISRTQALNKANIFLLFNKLSDYKKIIYDSFVKAIGERGKVDLFIYHNDPEVFKNRITENLGNYNYYIVIPHFNTPIDNIQEILSAIPPTKLIVLDKCIDDIQLPEYNCVFQNYEKDIYHALHSVTDLLEKYEELVMAFPEKSYYPDEIKSGFVKFCEETHFRYRIISEVTHDEASEKTGYVLLEEKSLIQLIKNIKRKDLDLGKNIGILSYNENPYKEFLLNGITVISTDFEKMGEAAASMITNKTKGRWENPFYIIRRNSL